MSPRGLSDRALFLGIAAFVVIQAVGVLSAADCDGSLWLSGSGVGLLEHPGVFAIILGNGVLLAITFKAGRMTLKIGRKLPSTHRALVRRYFRSVLARRLFGRSGIFPKAFLFLAIIGGLALVNQSVRLANPILYYGHDTFDSVQHVASFWTVRAILACAWCVITPLFFTTLFTHALAVKSLTAVVSRRRIGEFELSHPDRCGGYAYFGWLDTLYVLGLVVVMVEVALLIVTHQRAVIGSVLALLAITGGAVIISIYSIRGLIVLVRTQERRAKVRRYRVRRRKNPRASVEDAVLTFGVKFSPYTTTGLRIALATRVALVIPTAIRTFQLILISR
jgi:hypothetical protein